MWMNPVSGNGLLPDSPRPLPETMLANHQRDLFKLLPTLAGSMTQMSSHSWKWSYVISKYAVHWTIVHSVPSVHFIATPNIGSKICMHPSFSACIRKYDIHLTTTAIIICKIVMRRRALAFRTIEQAVQAYLKWHLGFCVQAKLKLCHIMHHTLPWQKTCYPWISAGDTNARHHACKRLPERKTGVGTYQTFIRL